MRRRVADAQAASDHRKCTFREGEAVRTTDHRNNSTFLCCAALRELGRAPLKERAQNSSIRMEKKCE